MSNMVPIAHYERKYHIAPNGAVWNLGKHCWQATTQNPNGYMKVLLSMNGKREQFLLHRLVALHFLPNPYNHEQVNHKNGDKTDNSVSNLEWVNRSQNIQHSLETGLRKGFMSLDEKSQLLKRVLDGELIRTIAQEIGRREESLTGMLRRHAESLGLLPDWQSEMKQRRRRVAIKNIEAWNDRDT